MFGIGKKFDRAKAQQQIEALKSEGDARVTEAKKRLEDAHKKLIEWESPRVEYVKAKQKLDEAVGALDRNVAKLECELRADAAAHIQPAREWLLAEFQRTQIGIHTADERDFHGPHLKAIRAAITALDELATTGEPDVPEAVRRIMATVPSRWIHGADDRIEKAVRFTERAQEAALV